jgi:hypothetical protein
MGLTADQADSMAFAPQEIRLEVVGIAGTC